MSRYAEIEARLDELAPKVLPVGWTLREEYANARAYTWKRSNGRFLTVIAEIAEYDGALWFHVSASAGRAVPTWEELAIVKRMIVGRERLALSVLPPEDEYINDNPGVLHLWCPLEGRPIPDFRKLCPQTGRLSI